MRDRTGQVEVALAVAEDELAVPVLMPIDGRAQTDDPRQGQQPGDVLPCNVSHWADHTDQQPGKANFARPPKVHYGDKIRRVWYSDEGGKVKEGMGIICDTLR